MMTRLIWTLAFVFLAVTLHAPHAFAHEAFAPHIRSDEPDLLDALTTGAGLSPTLRALVDRLDSSDVVVYLRFGRSSSPTMAGHLSFITAAAGRRYLQVTIDRRPMGCRRIAILGHELQHAVEIAASPAVTGEPSLAELYRRIGFRSGGAYPECFDSAGAILAGRSVEKEVLAAAHAIGSR